MIATNLKIIGVVLTTILLFTFLANAIPQIESAVPEELVLGEDFSVEEIVAAGEQIYFGAGGCTACHGTGTRAPSLLLGEPGLGAIGVRCGDRVPGLSCKEYLWQAMVAPNEYVVEGFQAIMPDMRRLLSEAQIWATIAFMESQGGEVTVTAEDLTGSMEAESQERLGVPEAAPGGPAAVTGAAGVTSASLDPMTLLREHQCLACHVLGDEGAPLGPPLTGIGARRDAAFIRRAILDPQAEITPGFEAMAGVMPANFGEQMTAAQLEVMVQYLSTQR